MSQLTVIISPTGHVTIDVLGGTGNQCHTLTRMLEQALGETHQDTTKPEFFEQTQANHDTLQY